MAVRIGASSPAVPQEALTRRVRRSVFKIDAVNNRPPAQRHGALLDPCRIYARETAPVSARQTLFRIDVIDNPTPNLPYVIVPIGFVGKPLDASGEVRGVLVEQRKGQRDQNLVAPGLFKHENRKPFTVIVDDRADLNRILTVRRDDDVGHAELPPLDASMPTLSSAPRPSSRIDALTSVLIVILALYIAGHFALAWFAGRL